MSQTYIKYPVAYNFKKNSIVAIKEVTKENKLNLICPECRNNFIAVLNHRTPHFKHKPHSTCKGSPESYLHWLTKEVFKRIKEIEIPELLIDDLPEKHRQKFQYKYNKIIDANVPESFRAIFKKGLKKELSISTKISIDKYDIEKEFKTKLGNIVVDIVAEIKTKKIFIEPYFSNPIDVEKKEKLSIINIPTFSINLLKFIDFYGQNYSIKSLKNYLISKESKNWICLSTDKYNKHIENYEKYLIEEIKRSKDLIDSHNIKLIKVEKLELECRERYDKINTLKEEIEDLEEEIFDLKEELGINY